MRITCPNCGGAHPAWDCKRPATKSAGTVAVRPGRVSQAGSIPAKGNEGSSPSPVSNKTRMPGSTGSERVATKSAAARKDVRDKSTGPGARAAPANPVAASTPLAGTQALPVDTPTKRPRGRPRIHPDRKAYKAQWERDKRKRMKAKGGKVDGLCAGEDLD